MPTIKVDFNKLSQLESQLNRLPSYINSASTAVKSVRSGLDWDVASEDRIDRRLRDIANTLNDSKSRMQKTAQFVGNAVQQYQKAENGVESVNKSQNSTSQTNSYGGKSVLKDVVFDAVGGMGVGGAFASWIAKPFVNFATGKGFTFGDNDYANQNPLYRFSSGAGAAAKLVDDLFQWRRGNIKASHTLNNLVQNSVNKPQAIARRTAYNVKSFFGLNKVYLSNFIGNGAQIATGGTAFVNNVTTGFCNGMKDLVKSGWGKAAIALTAIASGFENYADYKSGEIGSFDRVLVETVAETGTSLAMTAGATALVSAGLVAAGVVAAPAVAVTATAGVIVAGINGLVKWGTGKSVVEHVGSFAGDVWDGTKKVVSAAGKFTVEVAKTTADFIGDTAEAALDFTRDAAVATADFVGDAAEATADFVSDAVKETAEFVGDAAKETADFVGDAAEAVTDFSQNIVEATRSSDFVGDTLDATADFFGNTVEAAADYIGDTAKVTSGYIGDAADVATDFVEDAVKTTAKYGKNIAEGTVELVSDMYTAGKDSLESLGEAFSEMTGSIFSNEPLKAGWQ